VRSVLGARSSALGTRREGLWASSASGGLEEVGRGVAGSGVPGWARCEVGFEEGGEGGVECGGDWSWTWFAAARGGLMGCSRGVGLWGRGSWGRIDGAWCGGLLTRLEEPGYPRRTGGDDGGWADGLEAGEAEEGGGGATDGFGGAEGGERVLGAGCSVRGAWGVLSAKFRVPSLLWGVGGTLG
jgi:hypothetical protein